jgi:hypothetical protein
VNPADWLKGISRDIANRDFWSCGAALFSRDGFDDEAAGQFWIEEDFGAVERGVHEGNDFGIVESGRA